MRIVRPGSVVGPQQQYMYLKQLEWVKWGAVDEMRKLQVASTITTTTLVTPATPPAETDEDVDVIRTPPIAPPGSLPPVTPSRHIASATAKAKNIAPPGQPRKTPVAKRVARDSDDDEEMDVLPSLRTAPARNKVKTSHPTLSRGVTSSEQRPTRVTRSTAGALAIRKAGAGASTPAPPLKSSGQGPNKIPRLATTRNTSAARAVAVAVAVSTTHSDSSQQLRPIPSRRPQPPPSPVPSRLPTLIPSKRPHPTHSSSLSEVANTTVKRTGNTSDAWMTNNPSAVIVPATKSARPGLRSVRRRRSSFSSADVVA
jgi:cell division cycle 14